MLVPSKSLNFISMQENTIIRQHKVKSMEYTDIASSGRNYFKQKENLAYSPDISKFDHEKCKIGTNCEKIWL